MRNAIGRVLTLLLLTVSLAQAGESWVGLNVRVQPLYIETNKLSPLCFGVGAEASWFPMKRFLAEGRWSSSVFMNESAKDYKDFYGFDASPKIKPFTYWEAGAQINLIVQSGEFANDETKTVQTGTQIVTTTDANGVETRRKVPVYKNVKTGKQFFTNEYRLLGIRGGILGLTSGTDANVAKSSDTIRKENGTIIDEATRLDNYTNHKMSGYYVGVARTRVFYSEGLWNTVYIDALFSQKIEFKDQALTGFSNRKIGARIGFEGARRHIGGRVEAGIRPGIGDGGFYALTQFAIGLML